MSDAGPVVPSRETERLMLRGFASPDRDGFAALNADPRVMEHYPAPLTRDESDALVDRIQAVWRERGVGLWALERRDTGALIGYAGLWPVPDDLPIRARHTPCVEVGWRLAHNAWGHGYASEAAREALRFGFDELGLLEVVSFTSVRNMRSRAVMERLGMTHDPADDFEHPALRVGHPLRAHVLYRLAARRPAA